MVREKIIEYITLHKGELERKFGVTKIGLFGSYARDDAPSDSDIDIVVELEKPDVFNLIGIKQTLEEEFGKKVDVVRLWDHMSRSLRARIERDAIYV